MDDNHAAPPPGPQPHPFARFLTASLGAAQDGSGSEAIAVPTPAFAPVKWAVPVSGWGGPQGEAAFHPGRTAREPREQRLPVLRAKQVLRSMELLARHVIPRFAGA